MNTSIEEMLKDYASEFNSVLKEMNIPQAIEIKDIDPEAEGEEAEGEQEEEAEEKLSQDETELSPDKRVNEIEECEKHLDPNL